MYVNFLLEENLAFALSDIFIDPATPKKEEELKQALHGLISISAQILIT